MKLRPTKLGSLSENICQRFSLTIASPGSYTFSGLSSTNQDLGIAWANPLDHTALIDSAGIWTPTFKYFQEMLQMYISAYTGNVQASLTFTAVAVDSTGADIYTLGSYQFQHSATTIIDPELPGIAQFTGVGTGAPASGVHCSLGYSVPTAAFTRIVSNCVVVVPASIQWFGTP